MTTFYTKRAILLPILILFLSAWQLNADVLEFGQDLTESIDAIGATNQYTFEAAAGDAIVLRMRGNKNGVDACLRLLDPNGLEIAAECSTGLAEIRTSLPLSGTYKVLAYDNNHNDTGDFGISLELLNQPFYAEKLTCQAAVVGELKHNGAAKMYALPLEVGEVIRLIVQGGDAGIEPILELYDESGQEVAVSKRDKGRAQITAFVVPETGTYALLMTDENGNDLGLFEIGFQYLNKSSACAITMGCSEAIAASLDSEVELDVYRFDAAAGEHIVAKMRSDEDNIEPLLELYDSEGNLLASDAPTFGTASINNFAITETGTYTLLVSDQRYNDVGDYSLSFLKLNSVECGAKIDCDQTIEATLEERAEVDTYVFDGIEGDRLVVFMRGGVKELEASMELYDEDGELVAASESMGRLARIGAVSLPSTGKYTLLAKDANNNDVGNYFLTMRYANEPECAELASCETNSEVHRLETLAAVDVYTVECTEVGQSISVLLKEVDDFLEPHMEFYNPRGRRLLSNDGRDSVSFKNVKLTELGVYSIFVMDHEGNDLAEYTLNVTGDPILDCPPPDELEYCEAKGKTSDYEWIETFNLGDISNTSGNDGGYGDYTSLSTSLGTSQFHAVNLLPGFQQGAFFECWRIWIDFNQDGDFDDEGEMVFFRSSTGAIYGGVKIPASAKIGTTRMRVAMNYEAYPSQCGEFNYGEVEDYTVEIIPGSGCDALPDNWANQDLGAPSLDGSVCYDENTQTFFMESAGKDIFGKADQFHFAYTELCNDGEIVARVKGLGGANQYALAGVMIRNDLSDSSANAAMLVSTKGLGYFQNRKKKGFGTSYLTTALGIPYWVKLTRIGNKVTAYVSADGTEWKKVKQKTISGLEECVKVGLALTSNTEPAVLNQATFDNVSVTPYNNQAKTSNEPIASLQPSIQLGVFPNPVANQAFVEMEDVAPGHIATIVISNLSGETVFQTQRKYNGGVWEFNLAGENLLDGIYTLTVYYEGNQVSKQIVINNEF
ncbi:MAG: GEVED domain-containing protein [Bacteroidota bacterium]